jgi:iron complex outermembrane recepter protein
LNSWFEDTKIGSTFILFLMKEMKPILLLFSTLFIHLSTSAQQNISTDHQTLDSIIVRAFGQPISKTAIPSLCGCAISTTILPYQDFSAKTSVLNGLNSVSGVRMEERSPGSYRLSIRGSSLRSPFGVRNIKVYWNNIPITDPTGNTYFNQFAWNNFSAIELYKGPAGSMYGAGTGGLLILSNFENGFKPGINAEYITGSYNLHNVFVSGRFGTKESKNQFSYAHNETAGYRSHTHMRRDNFSWVSKMSRDKFDITTSVLFTNMHYQTPGALTMAEFTANPKAARPAAGALPSAATAKAAIYQKNILTGIAGQFRITSSLKNNTTVYGTFAQIKNPAIRNYERRSEPSFGGRSSFNFNKRYGKLQLGFIAGAEFQQGYFNTQVSKNKNGNPDTLQTNDDINNYALSVFVQANATIDSKWFINGGISSNKTKIAISRLSRYPVTEQTRLYRNEITPLLVIGRSVSINKSSLFWSATVSKGFSPPTIAEVLPSTGTISTDLEAERGWNYETTIRLTTLRNKLKVEATAFYFKLNDALVQRRDISGADYFVNAGNVKQKGIELHADFKSRLGVDFFRSIGVRSDVTLNKFRYGSFIKGTDDFSGKKLPSVPSTIFTLLADIECRNGLYLNANYYAASSIFLNDANTAEAAPYHLLGCQLGYKKVIKQVLLNIYTGADNLLNETYSLGNDINAAANRFYNAAPLRNYYVGIAFQWIKKAK